MELTKIQETILNVLREANLSKRFYWTGGTLLAVRYLHHRRSFDLDFFTDSPFSHHILLPFIRTVKKRLVLSSLPEKKIYDRWEFLIDKGKEPTRCEFAYYNGDKKRLAPLVEYKGVRADTLKDMAANKTMAYFDRNEPKDLFDLYAIITQKKFTVPELLGLVETKFGTRFSEFSFWSESTKSLKNLASLKPYLLQVSDERKLIDSIDHFFLEGGRAYLSQNIE